MAKRKKIDVLKTVKLANLPLEKVEKETYAKQLSEILEYFAQIRSVNTKGIEPTFNTTDLHNVARDDKAQTQLSQEAALKNAVVKSKGFILSNIIGL